MLANLLVNAQEAMDGEGEIRISSRVEQNQVYVMVQDNGPGLPTTADDSLFCSGWTTKGCQQGSGLGLFIARKIMQDFGGDIRAENHPSGGALMTIWLPLVAGDNQ